MTVIIERFDPAAKLDHGRPEVLRFTGPEGRLSLHVARVDRSLWLFAHGARGGDLGRVVIPATALYTTALLGWLDGELVRGAPSTLGALWIEPDRVVVADRAERRRKLRLRLDDRSRRALLTFLHEWAEAAAAVVSNG